MSDEREETQERDFGEPIARTDRVGNGLIVVDRYGAYHEFDELYDRGIACINAMRGIADPAAFVRAADALYEAVHGETAGSQTADYRAARGRR